MPKLIKRLRSVKLEQDGKEIEHFVVEIQSTEKPEDELIKTLKEEGFEIQQNENGLEGQKTINVYFEYHGIRERLDKIGFRVG